MNHEKPLIARQRLSYEVHTAVLALILCQCCTALADESKTKPITLADLTITIPTDWEVLENRDAMLTVRSPQEGFLDAFGENFRLMVYPMPRPATADQVLESQLRTVGEKSQTVGSGVLRASTPRITWMEIRQKSPPTPSDDLTKIDYILTNGNSLYVMHCMLHTDKVDKYRKQFEEIAESLVFTNPIVPKKAASNEKAYEQGRKFGGVWFRIMLAAVIGYGVIAIVRKILRSRKSTES